jgi:2'-5' RNA ligase
VTTESDIVRAFCGIPLDGSTREFIRDQTLELRRNFDSVRWVSPDQWHITLAFCGNISTEQSHTLSKALESIHTCPIRVRFCRLGAFPSLRRARVVWFGLDDPDGELAALQERVHRCSRELGHHLEARPFHPHVTLGRTRRNARLSLEQLPELPVTGNNSHMTYLNEFTLFESRLEPAGTTHVPLQRIALPTPPAG